MRSWMGSVVAPRVSELADLLTDTKGTGGNGNIIDETHKHAPLDLSNQDLKRMFSKTGLFTDLTHDQPTLISGDGTNDSDMKVGTDLPGRELTPKRGRIIVSNLSSRSMLNTVPRGRQLLQGKLLVGRL